MSGGSAPRKVLGSLRTSRIEALSDGVFSIAMTLLILQIEVPRAPGAGRFSILQQLFQMWPRFLSYAVSFLVLGVYWVSQHSQFHYIKRADHELLWATMLFLMLIAAVPFSATLIGRHLQDRSVVIFYGCHLVAIGLVHFMAWHHASKDQCLIDPGVAPELIREQTRLSLIAPSLHVLAVLLAFLSTALSIAVYLVVPVIYVVLPMVLARYRSAEWV